MFTVTTRLRGPYRFVGAGDADFSRTVLLKLKILDLYPIIFYFSTLFDIISLFFTSLSLKGCAVRAWWAWALVVLSIALIVGCGGSRNDPASAPRTFAKDVYVPVLEGNRCTSGILYQEKFQLEVPVVLRNGFGQMVAQHVAVRACVTAFPDPSMYDDGFVLVFYEGITAAEYADKLAQYIGRRLSMMDLLASGGFIVGLDAQVNVLVSDQAIILDPVG